MAAISAKMKYRLKQVALFGSLFLAASIGLFFLVNMDFSPAKKVLSPTNNSVSSLGLDSEIKKRLGSTSVFMESYSDWANRNGLSGANAGLDADPDKEGMPNYLEYVYGTDPNNADTDHDKYTDKQEIANGYDPADFSGDSKITVLVRIDKMGVEAPMVWSKSTQDKDMLKELESGVAHFDRTAAPGQIGNMIISGHSSNYFWAKGNYNHIFKDLNNLEKGDVINIKTFQKNGRTIAYQYKVTDKYVAAPDETRIFASTGEPTLTLSTCWPLGTNFKRLIVKASLIR